MDWARPVHFALYIFCMLRTTTAFLFLFLVHITIPFSSASAHSMLTVWTDRTGEAQAADCARAVGYLCVCYILSNLRLDGFVETPSILIYITYC